MKNNLALLLLALSFIAACSRVDPEAVRDQIESNNDRLTTWYANGQVDSIGQMFVPSARQMGPNSPPVVGRNAITRGWSRAVRLGTWTFTFDTKEVAVSGQLAVERGTYVLSFTPGPNAPPGMAPKTDRGNYLTQWQEEKGEWRIVNQVTTSEIPK